MQNRIPNRLIFIWFGSSFPIANQIAIKSAVSCCNPDETLLIQRGLTPQTPGIQELIEEYSVTLCDADESWFSDLPEGGETALSLFNALPSPASKANLLRMASLWKLGGIYIDMDTICIKNFDSLRHLQGFCGTESVALPGTLFHSKNPFKWVAAGLRLGFRELCVHVPYGYALFRIFERTYIEAVNNAVIGSAPKNPIWEEALKTIHGMPKAEQLKRFRLGTHLMQRLTGNTTSPSMTVLNHTYFYPLGPEISAFWFKKGYARFAHKMILPETILIHWYNSVEARFLKQSITEEYLESHPTTVFSELSKKYR